MLVFNSEMHLITLLFILLELMMFSVQLYRHLMWPNDKRCVGYLMLLLLLMCYNITGGLFPDPEIRFLSITIQNMLAYGSGFLMAAYFPFYFYKSFDLTSLKFHACYGAPLFLLLPYLVFFVLTYRVLGDLEFAIDYGLIVPGFYSPVLLFSMFRAVRIKQSAHSMLEKPYRGLEIHMIYWAVSPWVFMCFFAYIVVPQWIEVIFTNFGFVINGVLFLHRSSRYERLERLRLMEKDAIEARHQMHLIKNCMEVGLSSRETQIAVMLCLGNTYKGIGDQLFISSKTVDAHVQHIFSKTGVNRRMELQKILGCSGSGNQDY